MVSRIRRHSCRERVKNNDNNCNLGITVKGYLARVSLLPNYKSTTILNNGRFSSWQLHFVRKILHVHVHYRLDDNYRNVGNIPSEVVKERCHHIHTLLTFHRCGSNWRRRHYRLTWGCRMGYVGRWRGWAGSLSISWMIRFLVRSKLWLYLRSFVGEF